MYTFKVIVWQHALTELRLNRVIHIMPNNITALFKVVSQNKNVSSNYDNKRTLSHMHSYVQKLMSLKRDMQLKKIFDNTVY